MTPRLLALLASSPGLTDREATDRLLAGTGKPPQSINALARRLEAAGVVKRLARADGLIANYLATESPGLLSPVDRAQGDQATGPAQPAVQHGDATWPSEDALKALVGRWLEAKGWDVLVKWGHARGIDMDARRGDERWIIEVKGGGSLQPMRVNYFLCILGETLQRMGDRSARYSIALPDLAQFRGLWRRLPELAKERTRITALFVNAAGSVDEQH